MIHAPDEHKSTARIEAFSDGVFAIAITLLVLEIRAPDVGAGESLAAALRHLWPSYIGYGVSFITVGVMWANHHTMFKDIDRHDHTLVVVNLLLLMAISFLPFPTAVLAKYLRDEHQRLTATLAYGATIEVIAALFQVLWLYAAAGRRLIDEHVSDARVRSRTIRFIPGFVAYSIALPLAFIDPWISVTMYAALALFFLLPIRD